MEQTEADDRLIPAIERFEAPSSSAGDAASAWLKRVALGRTGHVATYVLLERDEAIAFYSLGMGELELPTHHRKRIGASHPRVGAVVLLWLGRAASADVDAEAILSHAVGIGRVAGRHVGAAVIALDPFDAATEAFWRRRCGFRASRTRRRDATGQERARLWLPLYPAD